MPTDPLQLTLAVLECALIFAGAGLLLWLLFNPAQRSRWLRLYTLPTLPLSMLEFGLAAVVIKLTEFAFGIVAQITFSQSPVTTQNHTAILVIVINLATYAGALLAWRVLFPHVLRMWQVGPEPAPARPTRQTLSWSEATGYGIGTVLVALPLIILIGLGWSALLQAMGRQVEPQDMIMILAKTRSPLVIAGLMLVACLLAPLYEELLFRAGLYRYVRQKLGRTPALLISGICFGVMHRDLTAFLPLVVLGMLFALVYEATGSIRVTIIAHGLFNLNSIIFVLAGFSAANP